MEKLISLAITKDDNNHTYKEIGEHCYNFVKQSMIPAIFSYFLCYETNTMSTDVNTNINSSSKRSGNSCNNDSMLSPLFYDTSITETNTWIEIPQPDAPMLDRSAGTLIKTSKDQTIIVKGSVRPSIKSISSIKDNIPEVESLQEQKLSQSLSQSSIVTKSQLIPSPSSLRQEIKKEAKKENIKKEIKKPQIINNNPSPDDKTKKKKAALVEFPSYDIPNFKFTRDQRMEPDENERLRKEFEMNNNKKIEMAKREIEAAKIKRIHQFNVATKKEFDGSRYTFDSSGKIIHMKRLNYESLFQNCNEFGKSKLAVKNPPSGVFTQDIYKKDETTTEEVIKNDVFSINDVEQFQFMQKKNRFKKTKNNIAPSGSNFDIIKPEVGVVVVGEDNRKKEGSKDFNIKYNKTSIYDYSRLLNESMIYNDNMVKRGVISEIIDQQHNLNSNLHEITPNNNDISNNEQQPYYGYKDNFTSSNNPLIQDSTKQVTFPQIVTSHEMGIMQPSFISTQSNPLIAQTSIGSNRSHHHLIKTKVYKGGTDEDTIHIKNYDSFKDFQKSLEMLPYEYSLSMKPYYNTKNLKRNASDMGDVFKYANKKQMFKNENMFHDIDEFNSSVIRDDASKYVVNNRNNQNNLDVFNRLHKGNKIKELGVKIVNVKMPRERKFNLNQYSDIEKKYSIIHRRKQSMGI